MVYKTKIGTKKEYSKIKTLARVLEILSKCKKSLGKKWNASKKLFEVKKPEKF